MRAVTRAEARGESRVARVTRMTRAVTHSLVHASVHAPVHAPEHAGSPGAGAHVRSATEDQSSQTERDRQRERTRLRVRKAALAVFRRDGIAAAKIDDIVRAARVSRGTFYFHFPAKEDVVLEVLREAEHRIAAGIAELPRSTPLETVLEVTCARMAEEWENEPRLFPEVGSVAVRRAAASFREGQRDPVSLALADGFRAAVARGELTAFLPAEVLADFFLVNVLSAALSWCAHPKFPLRGVLSSVIGIFLNGARAQRRVLRSPPAARNPRDAKAPRTSRRSGQR